jgi:hypothetical protein
MRIEFWGVRGTSSAPDNDKMRYGGNTNSIVITDPSAPNHLFLLEAGTGLARFGNTMNLQTAYTASLLLCNLNLYRIIGFQFTPLTFIPHNKTQVIGPSTPNFALETVFDHIMAPVYSPVYGIKNLTSDVQFMEVENDLGRIGDVRIIARSLGNSWGYRLEINGRSLVYIADAQLHSPERGFHPNAIELVHDANIFIAGASDPNHENGTRYLDAIELAAAANVRRLYLTHHHPNVTDRELDYFQSELKRSGLPATIAAEGMVAEL